MPSPENPNWLFDCTTMDDFSLAGRGAFLWEARNVGGTSRAGIEDGSRLINHSGSKEPAPRKRARQESSSVPASKACREKLRRDKLHEKFVELASLLDGNSKMDKVAILSDAVRKVAALRNEARKLIDSNQRLKQNINKLKNAKNELREEKQRLKEEKGNLEQQVKTMNMQQSFLPYPPMVPCFTPVHADGSKLMMPYSAAGHPGFVFQFQAHARSDDNNELPPAA